MITFKSFRFIRVFDGSQKTETGSFMQEFEDHRRADKTETT